MTDAPAFKIGDLVTRDGTDLQEVVREDDGFGSMRVRCVVAPRSGWCQVGQEEDNLVGRYLLARRR